MYSVLIRKGYGDLGRNWLDGVRCVLGFLREGVGDLGRKWLEKTSRSRHIETALYCDELEDERLNVLQIMAVKLVAA